MSKIHRSGSKMEIRVKELFSVLGVRFVYQPKTDGKPDFFLPAFGIALFADSCFWHFCPEHGKIPKTRADWWRAKLERNRERDAETTARLESAGVRVARIWEHDLKAMTPADLLGLLVSCKTD